MRETRAPRSDTDKAAQSEVARGALAYKFRPAINAREDAPGYDSGTDGRINCLALIKLRVFARARARLRDPIPSVRAKSMDKSQMSIESQSGGLVNDRGNSIREVRSENRREPRSHSM